MGCLHRLALAQDWLVEDAMKRVLVVGLVHRRRVQRALGLMAAIMAGIIAGMAAVELRAVLRGTPRDPDRVCQGRARTVRTGSSSGRGSCGRGSRKRLDKAAGERGERLEEGIQGQALLLLALILDPHHRGLRGQEGRSSRSWWIRAGWLLGRRCRRGGGACVGLGGHGC